MQKSLTASKLKMINDRKPLVGPKLFGNNTFSNKRQMVDLLDDGMFYSQTHNLIYLLIVV